jgi:hypothetical protein
MKADFSEAQCIEISPQRLLIALPDGRSWLTELSSSSVTNTGSSIFGKQPSSSRNPSGCDFAISNLSRDPSRSRVDPWAGADRNTIYLVSGVDEPERTPTDPRRQGFRERSESSKSVVVAQPEHAVDPRSEIQGQSLRRDLVSLALIACRSSKSTLHGFRESETQYSSRKVKMHRPKSPTHLPV